MAVMRGPELAVLMVDEMAVPTVVGLESLTAAC